MVINMNIRDYIKNNFKDSKIDDIKASIESAIVENDEITLPGLGVLFELLWISSDKVKQNNILEQLIKELKKENQ